jgi:hypothetical protein
MCGLTAGYPTRNAEINFDKLAYIALMNEERGTDSTGLAIGEDILKEMGAARKFINNNIAKIKAIDKVNKPIIMHDRSASYKVGINITQAHPFRYNTVEEKEGELHIVDYFIGMHNGLIKEEQKMIDTYIKPFFPEIKKEAYSVDSQVIIHALSLCNTVEEMSTILSTYDGNAALIFYNKDTFYVWKGGNLGIEERPLYYAKNEEGWYFSSIRDSLSLVSENITMVLNNQLLIFSEGEMRESLIIPRAMRTWPDYSEYTGYQHKRHSWEQDRSLFQDGSPSQSGRENEKTGDRLQLPSHSKATKEYFSLSHKLLFQDARDKTSGYYNGQYIYNPLLRIFTSCDTFSTSLTNNSSRHIIHFKKGIALKRKADDTFEKLMSKVTNDIYTDEDLQSRTKLSIGDYIYNFIPVTQNKRVTAILYLENDDVKILTPQKDAVVDIDLFGKYYTFYSINGLFKSEYNFEIK